MYKKFKTIDVTKTEVENIVKTNPDGSQVWFPNVDSNNGPERQAYLAWVAEGNVAEEWNPNGN
jgi:hypothetical protein